ncbi:Upf1, partial [Symbiodinium microadriaticum]
VQNFRSRWHFRTLPELVRFGLALDSRRVEWRSGGRDDRGQPPLPGWPAAGQEEVHFSLGPHATEERSQFKAGEQVLISRGDPLKNRVCEGSVREVDFIGRVMIVSVNGKMPEDPWMVRRYRIDKYANRTTYERQVNALMQFIMMDRTKVCDMLVAAGVGRLDEAVVEEAAIMKRRMERKGMGKGYKGKRQTELAKQDQATKDKTRSSALLNWDAEDFFDDEPDQVMEAPPEEVLAEPAETEEEKERRERTVALAHEEAPGVDPDALELAKSQAMSLPNTSAAQKEAIINSMSKRLTIVQGPPGTGKTHTSVRILTTWVKTMGYRPLLATSECNVAVDNIAEGLLDNGIKVVRIGRLEKVSPKLQQAGLTNLIRQKREEAMLEEEFLDEDEDPGEEPEDRNGEEWKEWRRLRDKQLRRRAEERQKERFERDKILEQAEVICATTIASGGQQLNGFTFRGVLIDEVAQATETSCTVPIVCRNAQQLVLCGDHCQLPPSVLSRESQLRGLSLSLYSRLTGAGVPFQFLDTQYRAHPMLMEFSARNIYDGKLLHGVQGSERPRPNGIPWPGLDCPAMFMESNVEEHLAVGPGRCCMS